MSNTLDPMLRFNKGFCADFLFEIVPSFFELLAALRLTVYLLLCPERAVPRVWAKPLQNRSRSPHPRVYSLHLRLLFSLVLHALLGQFVDKSKWNWHGIAGCSCPAPEAAVDAYQAASSASDSLERAKEAFQLWLRNARNQNTPSPDKE
jgi:hypothetical protein